MVNPIVMEMAWKLIKEGYTHREALKKAWEKYKNLKHKSMKRNKSRRRRRR